MCAGRKTKGGHAPLQLGPVQHPVAVAVEEAERRPQLLLAVPAAQHRQARPELGQVDRFGRVGVHEDEEGAHGRRDLRLGLVREVHAVVVGQGRERCVERPFV